MFNVGDKAIYPGHGIGVIKRIESRKIGGVDTDFLVVQILTSSAVLMVPANSCERAGMRAIASADEIQAIYDILKSPAKFTHTTWNCLKREGSK